MSILNLENLKKGYPGISPSVGNFLAEVSAFCLDRANHVSGVYLTLQDEENEIFQIIWHDKITSQVANTWNDPQEATEFGAVGIAACLIEQLSRWQIVLRADKGNGFDYWLGYIDAYGQRVLRAGLEVSGIEEGNSSNNLKTRMKEKIKQVQKAHYLQVPIYIFVLEFGEPIAQLEKQFEL